MFADAPQGPWEFFVPLFIFVLIAIVMTIRPPKPDGVASIVFGFAVIGLLIWQLINFGRFLIYVIPYSDQVISNRYFAAPAVLVGLVLYHVRGRYQFLYGMVEVCVALLAIFVSIGTPSSIALNKIVGILGGVYILVRGLDNIDKGLPGSWRRAWDWCFPKAPAKTPLPAEGNPAQASK
jgi:hypothetical protein